MLALQRMAGNAAVTRAVEQERHRARPGLRAHAVRAAPRPGARPCHEAAPGHEAIGTPGSPEPAHARPGSADADFERRTACTQRPARAGQSATELSAKALHLRAPTSSARSRIAGRKDDLGARDSPTYQSPDDPGRVRAGTDNGAGVAEVSTPGRLRREQAAVDNAPAGMTRAGPGRRSGAPDEGTRRYRPRGVPSAGTVQRTVWTFEPGATVHGDATPPPNTSWRSDDDRRGPRRDLRATWAGPPARSPAAGTTRLRRPRPSSSDAAVGTITFSTKGGHSRNATAPGASRGTPAASGSPTAKHVIATALQQY